MKIAYTFAGIETARETYPRAVVLATLPDGGAWPFDAFIPQVRISLPIADLSGDLGAIRDAAIRASRRLLNEPELEAWLQAQRLPTIPPEE